MEETILTYLTHSELYARKVLPHLDEGLFSYPHEKLTFNLIKDHINKYNVVPSLEVLYIELENVQDISQEVFNDVQELIAEFKPNDDTKIDWLIDQTETFVQDRSLQNAIRRSIRILDSDTELTKAAIPKLLQDALSVSFSSEIGHDFVEDAEARYEQYHQQETKLRFNIDLLNRITSGGLPDKTLSCIIAPTGVGKSMAMCSLAAGNLMDQKNVLYITLEMAEEAIAQRIDANLLDTPMNKLVELSKEDYKKRIDRLKESTKGRLIIKEYPTASANSTHIRNLLDELKIKKNFVPDAVYIDYLNLCTSSRIKQGAGTNSYTYIKAIAEELRGLAVEYGLPFITATQANRDAMGASDLSLTNTSDSIGLPMTVDFMIALIATEELDEDNQIMVKQLKNRFGDPGMYRRFVVGVDKEKMRLYDADNSDVEAENKPVMDNTEFGDRIFDEKQLFKGFD